MTPFPVVQEMIPSFFDSTPNGTTNVDDLTMGGDTFEGAGAAGGDVIHLDLQIFDQLTTTADNTLLGADFIAGAVSDGQGHGTATGVIVYNTSTGALFYDLDGSGGDGSEAVQFATLDSSLALTEDDFFVIDSGGGA